MRWLKAAALATVLFLTISSPVLADTSASVTVTAVGWIGENPGAPSGLTLTYVSDYEVGISWTKGASANNTMIRKVIGRLPTSITDGIEVYYGTGTGTTDYNVNLDTTDAPAYYRAWSQDVDGDWEEVGVSNSIEGVGMTVFAVTAIVLVLMAMGFIFKSGILFLASSLGWILFAFLMFGKAFDNAAMNTGLLMFGGAMAIVTAVLALNMLMSGRQRPSLESDYESYKKKVMNATRRR